MNFQILKRIFDIVLALISIALSAPIVIIVLLFEQKLTGSIKKVRKIGKNGSPFEEFYLSAQNPKLQKIINQLGLSHLPSAINILLGDISLIGPRALTPEEYDPSSPELKIRQQVRPGILSLWWIRKQNNMGYEGEIAVDVEYVKTLSMKRDIGILCKVLPTCIFGSGDLEFNECIKILDIPLKNLSMNQAIEKILKLLKGKEIRQICFVNADCANIAWNDADYMQILNRAEMNLVDGIGMKLGGKVLHQEIQQNVNGTDLFPRLMKAMEKENLGVFFLGAKPEVNATLVEKVRQAYPDLKISGSQHGFYKSEDLPQVLAKIRNSHADLLLVAFGAPKQEKWIAENLPNLSVKVAMGVGGLFDFYSGKTARAPFWMREIGMEWFFRFLQEPGRMWKRYFVGNFVFMYRVLRAKSGINAPSLINGANAEHERKKP